MGSAIHDIVEMVKKVPHEFAQRFADMLAAISAQIIQQSIARLRQQREANTKKTTSAYSDQPAPSEKRKVPFLPEEMKLKEKDTNVPDYDKQEPKPGSSGPPR